MTITNLEDIRKAKAKPLILEFQDELKALCTNEKYGDLTASECIGILEMFKWAWIDALDYRED